MPTAPASAIDETKAGFKATAERYSF